MSVGAVRQSGAPFIAAHARSAPSQDLGDFAGPVGNLFQPVEAKTIVLEWKGDEPFAYGVADLSDQAASVKRVHFT